MQGKPVSVFGDGTQQRAFSYVVGVAPVIASSPWVQAAHNEIINIGADVSFTIIALAREVAATMGAPAHPIQHLPQRNEVQVAYCDHDKEKRIFGLRHETPLREGPQRMAQWARGAGIRRGKAFEGVGVSRNMPPSRQRIITGGRQESS